MYGLYLSLFILLFSTVSCRTRFRGFTVDKLSALHKIELPSTPYYEYSVLAEDSMYLYGQCWQAENESQVLVALVHGLGDHSGDYNPLVAHLLNAGYSVITFDLRGHGKSQGKRGYIPSYEILLNDIEYFLKTADSFYPHKKIVLYGHSFGGNLVINYALKRKPEIAGIVLSAPLFNVFFKPPLWQMCLGRICSHIFPRITVNSGINSADKSRDPNVSLIKDTLSHEMVSSRFLEALDAGSWALEHAGELKYQTLIVHGDSDRIASSVESRIFSEKAYPFCDYIEFSDHYHVLHQDFDKDIVFGHVVDFLDELDSKTDNQ